MTSIKQGPSLLCAFINIRGLIPSTHPYHSTLDRFQRHNINGMDTESTKENFQEVMEYVKELQTENAAVDINMDDLLPQESEAHQELRNEVKPLIEKIHKDYNRLFVEAYEQHDLAKAQKLRKLLTEMLVLIRSSD